MPGTLRTRAEVEKLARLLHRDPEDLAFLEAVDPDDLARLRDQVTDALYAGDDAALDRVAAAARLLPPPLSATLAQRAFGPLLSARIASRMDPGRAVELAERLPDGFLADVAVELDPRRASEVIAGMPIDRIVASATELVRRGEYVTLGRFIGHLAPACLNAVILELDDADLLRIAFVSEDHDYLERVVAALPDARLEGMIRAADEHGLWPEALALVVELDDGRVPRLAALAAAQDDRLLDGLLAAAHAEGLWAAIFPLAGTLDREGRRRFARRPAFRDPEVLRAVTDAAVASGRSAELLPLVQELEPAARAEVLRLLPLSAARARRAAGS